MSDRSDITDLIYLSGELVDEGQFDAAAALFERSSWRSARRQETLEGAGQVRKIYDDVILYDGRPCIKHILSNVSVQVDSATEGSARSCYTVFQAVEEFPLQAIMVGRYHDQFKKGDDGWYFSDRLVIADLIGDLSRHMGSSRRSG
jgi:3-phenylpropionate/cinnamic acid dioxygenase small subunit